MSYFNLVIPQLSPLKKLAQAKQSPYFKNVRVYFNTILHIAYVVFVIAE